MAKLLRVDRNGTKYWTDCKCRKCGGRGFIEGYAHVERGVCFDCRGSGIEKDYTWKEYTPEYAKKLAQRRLAKAKAKAPERNAKLFKRLGMSEAGKAYVVIGDTFELKDQLKEAGARWNDLLGWHFDHEQSEYPCFEVSIDEIADKGEADDWQLHDRWLVFEIVKEKRLANAPKTDSQYIGAVGDKVELELTYVVAFEFRTHFTYKGETSYLYKFADADGNTVTWKTSKWLDIEEGQTYKVAGTIKDHTEYKGDKQTVLTRCKVVA